MLPISLRQHHMRRRTFYVLPEVINRVAKSAREKKAEALRALWVLTRNRITLQDFSHLGFEDRGELTICLCCDDLVTRAAPDVCVWNEEQSCQGNAHDRRQMLHWGKSYFTGEGLGNEKGSGKGFIGKLPCPPRQ
jgi:hypothetical protein